MKRPIKLVIQIPCFNEAPYLPTTLAELPRSVPGVDVVEWLVIDDGSSDSTAEVAKAHGVDHVVRFPQNRGLARAFMAGIDASVRLGADIIVNTDADNQYPGRYIEDLVRPILEGRADVVIADRQTSRVEHFSGPKKVLQRIGSWVVRQASHTEVPDAVSGFRAWSREAALHTYIVSDYSYTIESIIQAGSHRRAIASVPIRTNPITRESRLMRSLPQYLRRSAATILRIYTMYKPLNVFLLLALVTFLPALVLGVRFLVHYVQDPTMSRHLQSLILVAILTVTSVQLAVFALLADLVAANRRLLEDVLVRVRRLDDAPDGDHETAGGAAPAPGSSPDQGAEEVGEGPRGGSPGEPGAS